MNFANREGLIWFDGEFIPWKEARTHVLTHSLHYGTGVFEGVRAYKTSKGPAIFRLQDHTNRLFKSAHILQMKINFSKETLLKAQTQIVLKNKLDSAYLRPICFYGSEGMGIRADNLNVHVAIAAWKWPSCVFPGAMERGIKVKTSSFTRHQVNSMMCKAKATGNYMNSTLALKEAIDAGCEDALLLDKDGYVTEGSGANFFMIKDDGVLYTPALTSCLEGITRETIISFAKEIGLCFREKQITRDEVYTAKEAFFTGTAVEIIPICVLDNRTVGSGKPGVITKKLQMMYLNQVQGKTNKNSDWLTLCNN